jgi:hypothetical protein
MYQRLDEARIRHGEGRLGTRPARPMAAGPFATGGHDGVGERRRCRERDELLAREGTRISPGGGGALGRDRSASSGPGRCLGSVGAKQPDR